MKLHDLKEARALRVAEMRGLLTAAETQKRSLTSDEQGRFDNLKGQIADLEANEQRAQFLEDAERRSMGHQSGAEHRDQASLEGRVSLLDAINAQVEGRALNGALAEYQQEQKRIGIVGRGVLVPQSLFEKRVQNTGNSGSIVPDDFLATEYIGLMRNSMVVKQLGARVLPNLRGDTVIPKALTAHTAQWIGQGEALTPADATFGSVTLTPKHVGGLTSVSRQLLQQSNPAIESLIRDDFVQVVSLAVDKALIDGNGVTEPMGILARTGVGHAVQTGTLATVDWEAVLTIMEKLALVNATPNAWVTHPSVATVLRSTLKDSGLPGYLMENGQLAGLPVAVTNQISAAAANDGRLILGDFSQIVIGQWGSVDILANPYESTAYTKGEVLIRILATMDMNIRNENAFVLVEDVTI